MTWLTHMVASVIGASAAAPDPRKGQSDLLWDGRLCRCVFQLVQLLDFRLNNTGGQGKSDAKLEIAVLNFFKAFKKVFMMDTVNGPSMGMGVVPGGSPAHPLLSLALSYSGGLAGSTADKIAMDGGPEVTSVYDAMNMGDMAQVTRAPLSWVRVAPLSHAHTPTRPHTNAPTHPTRR